MKVYSWGYGDMNALGHGIEQDEPEPKKIAFKKKTGIEKVTQVLDATRDSMWEQCKIV